MSSGKADVRITKRNGKARIRFYGVAPDHLDMIQLALKEAREQLNTEYDTVALEAICLDFLINRSGKFVENSQKFKQEFEESMS